MSWCHVRLGRYMLTDSLWLFEVEFNSIQVVYIYIFCFFVFLFLVSFLSIYHQYSKLENARTQIMTARGICVSSCLGNCFSSILKVYMHRNFQSSVFCIFWKIVLLWSFWCITNEIWKMASYFFSRLKWGT